MSRYPAVFLKSRRDRRRPTMADPPRYPQDEEDTGAGPDRGAGSSTPRWVFVFGIIIAIAVIGLIVLLHLTDILGPGVH
jgi:hypothetical protein